MKFLAFTLSLCACFAQSPQRVSKTTNQFSAGACSLNASEVRGNVTITISGNACSIIPAELAKLAELSEFIPSLKQFMKLVSSKLDPHWGIGFGTDYTAGIGAGTIKSISLDGSSAGAGINLVFEPMAGTGATFGTSLAKNGSLGGTTAAAGINVLPFPTMTGNAAGYTPGLFTSTIKNGSLDGTSAAVGITLAFEPMAGIGAAYTVGFGNSLVKNGSLEGTSAAAGINVLPLPTITGKGTGYTPGFLTSTIKGGSLDGTSAAAINLLPFTPVTGISAGSASGLFRSAITNGLLDGTSTAPCDHRRAVHAGDWCRRRLHGSNRNGRGQEWFT